MNAVDSLSRIIAFYIALPIILYIIQPWFIDRPLWQGAVVRYSCILFIFIWAVYDLKSFRTLRFNERAVRAISGQILPTILFSIIALILFFSLRERFNLTLYTDPVFFLIYPVSVLIQRYVYSAYLSFLLTQLGLRGFWLTLLPAFLFAGMHLLYRSILVLPTTFIGGLFWQISFLQTGNLWGAIFGHTIVGYLISLFYLIPFPNRSWKVI